MQHVENELDNTLEKLGATNVKWDEKDKAFQLAEGEVAALQRKFTLLQDEHQRSESKLTQTTTDLNEASNKTDEINRAIKTLETKNMIDEESKSFTYTSISKLTSVYSYIIIIIMKSFISDPEQVILFQSYIQ